MSQKMTMKKSIALIASIVLSLGTVLPAAALAVDGNSGGLVNVNGQTYGLGGVNANASGSVQSDVHGSAGDDVNSDAMVTANATVDVGSPIVITRADAEDTTNGGTGAEASSVSSDTELRAYISGVIHHDTNVSAVSSSKDSVKMTYKQPARFLAVLPTSIDATATVNADGSINVSYPWYAFLFLKNRSTLEGKIHDAVAVDLGNATSADAALSPNVQARVIADVKAAMLSEMN